MCARVCICWFVKMFWHFPMLLKTQKKKNEKIRREREKKRRKQHCAKRNRCLVNKSVVMIGSLELERPSNECLWFNLFFLLMLFARFLFFHSPKSLWIKLNVAVAYEYKVVYFVHSFSPNETTKKSCCFRAHLFGSVHCAQNGDKWTISENIANDRWDGSVGSKMEHKLNMSVYFLNTKRELFETLIAVSIEPIAGAGESKVCCLHVKQFYCNSK